MIGVFGGTFDPVHYGHLKIAEHVRLSAGLQRLLLMPLHTAVHRSQPEASPAQRLAMLRLALKTFPELAIDEREISRAGPSYTVDTLQSLRKDYPETPLALLLGSDAFNSFLQWHKPYTILAVSHIIVMQRAGSPLVMDNATARLMQQRQCANSRCLDNDLSGRILLLPVPAIDISATRIRDRCRQDMPLDGLTSPEIIAYIRQNGLYHA